MLEVLEQIIEGQTLITRYTRDGETISHEVRTPIQEETEGEVIELPKNPILELQEENKQLKEQLADLWELMLFGGVE